MGTRLGAILLIYLVASLGWFVLGTTLLMRTDQSDTSQRERLNAQWGSVQLQIAPHVLAYDAHRKTEPVALRGSDVGVGLRLEQRRKGLLWYNLYDVAFAARYRVRNTSSSAHLGFAFAFPSSDGNFADFRCRIGGRAVDATQIASGVPVRFDLPPGAETTIDLAYRSNGMESWSYRLGDGVLPANDFTLTMTTNFAGIDFPPSTLLPTSERAEGNGWRLQWKYASLLTGNGIGMAFPYPPQPGPLAQRITFWAPVALLFYFFVMVVLDALRKVQLHPVNYFFLAAAFFAFHLLFAYLVDRIDVTYAFAICSAVSIFLTISYLRLVAGWRFAAVESGLAQLVYLVLFSFALFFEGWSGLAITIGAILTLFAAMQLTGRIRFNAA